MSLDRVTLALPSKGAIAEPTMSFLHDCGMRVDKPNPRQYVGTIPSIPGLDVLFQRVTDVAYKVADGTAQLGITGYDVVCEHPHDDLIVVHPDLRFGQCKLLVAVPESWVDVVSMHDFAEVALDFREEHGRNIRIATKYTYLSRRFLHQQGIHHFTLVDAEGAIEAAPTIGYADAIIDLAQTGTTLRENQLKSIPDGVIIESQACLIGNRPALLNYPHRLNAARMMLEYIDGALNGKQYSQITVNIPGDAPERIARAAADNPLTRGLQGPTVAPIFGSDDHWYTLTITVTNRDLLRAVEYLRSLGGSQVVVTPVRYVFFDASPTYARLLQALGLDDAS